MARPAKVWLRKQTGWFCVTVKGVITPLSKEKAEADRLFHELMARKGRDDEPPAPALLGPTFRKLADLYLTHTQGRKNAEVFAQQVKTLQGFSDHVKRLRAADLRPHHVTAWLAAKPTWGEGTRALNRKTLKACLAWGVTEGHLTTNPLKAMKAGGSKRRDTLLTADDLLRIRGIVAPAFADFLFAVAETGCRPYSEMARLTAADVDFADGTVTLSKHKTAEKTGRPRVIYLTPALTALLRRLAGEHPEGLLFRTRRGSAWDRNNSWKWFEKVERVLGIKAFPYALRHTRITQAILNGVPVEVVAELVGNTPQVIHKHYSHVGKDRDAMRAAARKAVSG